jgi:hypothetical protein
MNKLVWARVTCQLAIYVADQVGTCQLATLWRILDKFYSANHRLLMLLEQWWRIARVRSQGVALMLTVLKTSAASMHA